MTYSIDLADFTTAVETDSDVTGTGAFDVMMNSIRANVYEEYREGRITGAEYAQVYLSAMNSAADRALNFALSKDKAALEADNLVLQGELISKQIALATIEVTNAQIKATAEINILQSTNLKLEEDIDLLQKNDLILDQNLIEQTAIASSAVSKVAAEIAILTTTQLKLEEEIDVLQQQELIFAQDLIDKTSIATASTSRVTAEIAILTSTELKLQEEIDILQAQDLISAQELIDKSAIATGSTARVTAEIQVLTDTACKLKQEFEVLEQQELKIIQETGLAAQKTATEAAQITATNVDDNSVIGRQKELYKAQGEAFIRDGEQKAAKIMVDTWNVRKTTDEDTNTANTNLDNPSVGKAVRALMAGVDVTLANNPAP